MEMTTKYGKYNQVWKRQQSKEITTKYGNDNKVLK